MPLVIGVDPGSFHTGYAILKDGNPLDWGVLRPPQKIPTNQRLYLLGCSFKILLQTYADHSDLLLAIECAFMGTYARSVIQLSQIKGMFIFLAMELGIPIEELSARQVKRLFTGNGSSSKGDMLRAVSKRFQLPEEHLTHDSADALAIAFCAHQNSFTSS